MMNAIDLPSEFRKDWLPIWEAYADQIGMKLNGQGAERRAICDIHGGQNLNLCINVQSGAWQCKSCGATGGDVLDHHRAATGDSFVDAAKALGAWGSGGDRRAGPTQEERQQRQQRAQEYEQQRVKEVLRRQIQTQSEVNILWNRSTAVKEHPYTSKKGVNLHGLREHCGKLLVPLRDSTHSLWSVQEIAADGIKRYYPGGRVKGCYHTVGNPGGEGGVVVCEGYATGASIHQATGRAVVLAFDAGNIQRVASDLRAEWPEILIVIAADNDWHTSGNPGVTRAKAAAMTVGGLLAIPVRPADCEIEGFDFNDLHKLAGLDAVKRNIDAATPVVESVIDSPERAAIVAGNSGWPEPQNLIGSIEPQEYPLDALPKMVQLAVTEVAGFVKAPIPLIASSALSALSLAIQAHVDVERAEKLTGPTGLYLLAIADSGERKSTCDGFFTRAIKDHEAEEQEAAKPLQKDFKTKHEAWASQCSGVKEKIKALARDGKPREAQIFDLANLYDNEPSEPKVCRLIYGDVTPEELAFQMAKQWPSGGVISSEAGTVFGGHGMGKDSAMRNMALLNQLWDGAPLAVDRRTSDSFVIRGARLTMALQVQETAIRAFFDRSKGLARGTGFLARFLISWPASTQGYRMFTEAPTNWPKLARFNERLSAILKRAPPINDAGSLEPAMLKLAPDAKALWVVLHDNIEAELSSGREMFDVRDVASKAADNVARMAALFHTFGGEIGPISLESLESAGRIVIWHLTEAKRFLGAMALPEKVSNTARLDAWLLDYCRTRGVDVVSTREIQRNGPPGLRDKESIQEVVAELEELGRARASRDGKKKLVQVNPTLLA
jgi:putative DNA primase/helicase